MDNGGRGLKRWKIEQNESKSLAVAGGRLF
jgi:hypothetical protein